MSRLVYISIVLLTVFTNISCSSKSVSEEVIYETRIIQPGEAQIVWEEPIVDSIDVPPGLDPDGVYYRPGHKEVVEVRQGRYKYYQGPENCAGTSDCTREQQ